MSRAPTEPGWYWVEPIKGAPFVPARVYRAGDELAVQGWPLGMLIKHIPQDRWKGKLPEPEATADE